MMFDLHDIAKESVEKHGVFKFYVDTCQVKASNNPHVCIIALLTNMPPVGCGFIASLILAHILY